MSDKIDYLKYRLYQYQESTKYPNTKQEIPNDLLCIIADLILEIAKDIPNKFPLVKEVLLYIGSLMKRMCAIDKEPENANPRG